MPEYGTGSVGLILVGAGEFEDLGDLPIGGLQVDAPAVFLGGEAGLEDGGEAGGVAEREFDQAEATSRGQSGWAMRVRRAS